MQTDGSKERLQNAGITALRATILGVAVVLVLVLYGGMAYLVYGGQMSDGPLILFTGVLLGYLLRAVRGIL
jgi:hypothetical protein